MVAIVKLLLPEMIAKQHARFFESPRLASTANTIRGDVSNVDSVTRIQIVPRLAGTGSVTEGSTTN